MFIDNDDDKYDIIAPLFQLYALLLCRQPRLLDHVPQVTPSRQLALLTTKTQLCLADHRLARFSPATVAVAVLSLELELFAADWLPATIWLQTLAKVRQLSSKQGQFDE